MKFNKLFQLITEEKSPFAVFAVVKVENGYAATTRIDGRVGLPGGKVDPGEDYLEAVKRECHEEGWDISGLHPEIFHQQDVDGKLVYWFKADKAVMLKEYKEKYRGIKPFIADKEEILNSGFGNENLKLD